MGGWGTRDTKIEKRPASTHEYLSLVVWTTPGEPGRFSIFVALIIVVSLVAWIHGEPRRMNNSWWAWTLLYFRHIDNRCEPRMNNIFTRLVGEDHAACPIVFGDAMRIMAGTNWQELRRSIENGSHDYYLAIWNIFDAAKCATQEIGWRSSCSDVSIVLVTRWERLMGILIDRSWHDLGIYSSRDWLGAGSSYVLAPSCQ